jgi:hypothetical protein
MIGRKSALKPPSSFASHLADIVLERDALFLIPFISSVRCKISK